jgi:hypothetical protein
MPRMPRTRQRRHPSPSVPRGLAALAVLAAVTTGLGACSDDDRSAGEGPATSPTASAPAGTPSGTATPTASGAASDNAAWAAHRAVPAGLTRMASAKLSVGVPDGFEAVNDPQRLGTTDLAAAGPEGAVIAARVITVPDDEPVPEEGAAWAAAADVVREAENRKAKGIRIVDADVDGQDGWRVTWVSPKTPAAPALKHVWSLVDVDDTSFAIVSVQARPPAFKDGTLDKIGDTLVIRGVNDGTAPSPSASSSGG